jgi:microcin C transport system substrate-binding protein
MMRASPLLSTVALLACTLLAPAALAQAPANAGTTTSHGFTVLGTPKLPADYKNFPYVNPDAPRGGTVTLGTLGTFDSFNPFIIRGTAAAGLQGVYDTLLRPSAEEVATSYGLIAESIEVPSDRSWIAFNLRKEARFNDNTPVTADDVAWTFKTLREQGRPFFRQYYGDIADVTVEGPQRVVFHVKPGVQNRELPLILGEINVLPKHFYEGRDFSRPLSEPPLGSGPYRVSSFEMGRSVIYQHVPNYWAANLPVGKGFDNFGEIRQEYYRDSTVAMQAFKAGDIDFRQENIAKNWATAYDFPAVQKGMVIKEVIPHHLPVGMQGWAMNTRRPVFQDRRVREAIAWAYDFEWANKNLFYGAYKRTLSYFANSDLASSGLPQGGELALLDPFRKDLPADVFDKQFTLPVTDGSGNNREQLRHSLDLLQQAGWTVKDRKLVDAGGNQMSFTILLDDPTYERVALPYVQTLSHLGIDAHVRTVDPSQYQHMMDGFDFDMTMIVIPESDMPGAEERDYFTCAAAKENGSSNYMGVCNPAVDAMVQKLVDAKTMPELTDAAHALDRALLWEWYVVPNWHSDDFKVAYWNRFSHPAPPRSGLVFNTWWIDPQKSATTDAWRRNGG